MPLPQAGNAPVGATVSGAGTAFRVWAPGASSVHIAFAPPGVSAIEGWTASDANALTKAGEFWSGFVPGVGDGWRYRYWVAGPGGQGWKRDPRARELEAANWENNDCIVRRTDGFPWHDATFRAPQIKDLIIYQFHIGVFYARNGTADIRFGRVSKFLDAADRIPYLAALGVTAIQPLPLVEREGSNSRGYNNSDFCSVEMDYTLQPADIGPYLGRINTMLRNRGLPPLTIADISSQLGQLKAFVDLCHAYNIAVIADVVYNHAGSPLDPQCMRFFDQPSNQDGRAPDLYFIGGDGWAGGRIFDYQRDEVRGFLIDNARAYYDEWHVDGLRYDEIRPIIWNNGDRFCRDIVSTMRFQKQNSGGGVQIAEAWFDNDRALPVQDGGLGFDLTLDDRLRLAVRAVLAQAAGGASIPINLDGLRDALRSLWGYPYPWQSVQHLENHDIVDADRQNPSETQPRIAKLADWNDPRSWYARSRSRVATGILMTAPGVPMLFMGEEFLEFKPWHNNQNTSGYAIDWDGLDGPAPNPVMGDFHRFITDLIWLRRRHPGLRGRGCNPYFNHNDDRVIAIQRWNDVASRDLIAVASFSETTRRDYPLPLPVGGFWMEVFNADAYETMPAGGGLNVNVPGNPGGIQGDGPPLANCPTSARIVLPANGFLVFARDRGDNG